MSFQGMEPDKVRDLITAMGQAEAEADALSGDVTAALTLSELESPTPGQLLAVSDELDAVAVVLNARVDIVEGHVIDPNELATELGITIAQAEAAITQLSGDDIGRDDTPLLDLLVEQRRGAAILRQSFVGLPEPGTDPELDAAFVRLGAWLPGALESGEVPGDLTDRQIVDLALLQGALVGQGGAGGAEAIAAAEGIGAAFRIGLAGAVAGAGLDIPPSQEFGEALFAKVAETYELDARLRTAAGLPTVQDMHFRYAKHTDGSQYWQEEWAALDSWLPAYLAGEGLPTDDPEQWALAASLAANMGWRGPFGADFGGLGAADQQAQLDAALAHLRGGRFLQRSLIPGDFEGLDGPNIIWTEEGINSAILAGERQGVVDGRTRAVAGRIADGVLGGGDGEPIQLTEEQQQALVAAIAAQNCHGFVTDNDAIQRQIVAAINLIGQQTTLADQKRVFADTIEAFRSLNVVGAPAVTYRQLKEIVGPDVDEELGYKTLTARSAKATGKRPQLLSLVAHWGIPGRQKFKTKKRKFRFEFDEQGRLVDIRNKKISKWKRFKNTIKAIGKSMWKEWTDNPWKYLFMGPAGFLPGANQFADGVEDLDVDDMFDGAVDMTKFAATVAATVLPPSSAAGVAAWAAVAADTINDIQNDDWLGVASNALSAVSLGATNFTGAGVELVGTGADVASQVIDTVQSGDRLLDAIDDGGLIDIITSGLNVAGDLAPIVGGDADLTGFVNDAARFIGSGGQIVDGIVDGDVIGILDGAVGLTSLAVDDGNPDRTRDEGLLLALDQGLDVARLVDVAYRTGVVPDYATIATELAEFAVAGATVPAAPEPPQLPTPDPLGFTGELPEDRTGPNQTLHASSDVTEIPLGGGRTKYIIKDSVNGIAVEGVLTEDGDRRSFDGTGTVDLGYGATADVTVTGTYSPSTGSMEYTMTQANGDPVLELRIEDLGQGLRRIERRWFGEETSGSGVDISPGGELFLPFGPDVTGIEDPTAGLTFDQDSTAGAGLPDQTQLDAIVRLGALEEQAIGRGGPFDPVADGSQPSNQEERMVSLLADDDLLGRQWEIQPNPDADGSAPAYAMIGFGQDAVIRNDAAIERAAQEHDVDPDLLRAIVFVENSQGYYDAVHPIVPEAVWEHLTYRPMNVHKDNWLDLGVDPERLLNDPDYNIDVGAQIVKRIEARIIAPSIDKVATAYNSLPKDKVTDYGKRVERVHAERPWLDPVNTGMPVGLGPVNR